MLQDPFKINKYINNLSYLDKLKDAIKTNQMRIDALSAKIHKAKLRKDSEAVIELCQEKLQKLKELKHLKQKLKS